MRKSAIRELFSSLETLSISEVLEYKAELCEATHIMPIELERLLTSKLTPKSQAVPEAPERKPEPGLKDDSLECALCSLLMKEPRFRLRLSVEQVKTLLTSSDVRELAVSILNEDAETLSMLWLQTGDTNSLSLLERGDILCHQMGNLSDEEKFTSVYGALKRSEIERRIAEINALPVRERDMRELMQLYLEREKYAK